MTPVLLRNIHDTQVIVRLSVDMPVRAFRHGRTRPVTVLIPAGRIVDVGRALGVDDETARALVAASPDCTEAVRKGYLRTADVSADVTERSTPTPVITSLNAPRLPEGKHEEISELPPQPSMIEQVEMEADAPVTRLEPSMDWSKRELYAWAVSNHIDVSAADSKAALYNKIIGSI